MEFAQPYLEQMMGQLDLLSEEEKIMPENLYLYQPSHAAYDVRFGGRRDAKAIALLFQQARDRLYPDGLTDGFYLMALADTLEKMDEQLYEHYRVLADLMLEAARKALDSRDVRAHYALMKAVRLGLLDAEKYLPAAKKGFENAQRTPQNADFYRLALDEYGRIAQ
ncbi:MAG: hypothetical protein IJ214_09725 [Clostridia bacterium]|nr:hypothetical protein [Clostridia bacterium]